MRKCLYCYDELEATVAADYHAACSKKFFGITVAPKLPYRLDEMEKLAKNIVDLSITVPGVQPKLSLGWIKEKLQNDQVNRLTILNALDGNYILKPPNALYSQMPENEHLSMKLAALFKINVVPSSLIRLASGELCYITKRIDRKANGVKIHMLDFLQILELEHKYLGTLEMLGKKVGELSVNTLMDKLLFFELAVFNFIIGNNDMHLKNFSMILGDYGWTLSPAYDLINVKIILPKDQDDTALKLGGKKKNFNKAYFDRLGEVLELKEKQIGSVYIKLKPWLVNATYLIEKSYLQEVAKKAYIDLIAKRAAIF
ncbi:HipA domain-containing protein [Sediminibacterium sp.]|uniref:HipA domain-containing protein n=1 Tax=Sediminibacterium sp. TaxID=1917865 RepID=UPI003F7066A8